MAAQWYSAVHCQLYQTERPQSRVGVRTRWDGPTGRRVGPPVHCDQLAHEASSTKAFGVAWRGNFALLCPDLAGLAVVMGRMDGQ